ncbi:MAG TPA: FAD-dependent oxidoreductase, partial [Cytophagales bacterium]|nr:FAD-dependent oxidoreductase [Cytophagales bacterium]
MKKCILFIGADYTSIWAYKQLSSSDMLKKVTAGEVELVMICDQKNHYYHPFIGEVMSGFLPESAIHTPLRQIVKHAKIIHGKAVAVSPFSQQVSYTTPEGTEKEIHYDHLVMGCGQDQNSKLIAGAEKCIFTKKPHGLAELNKHLARAFAESSRNKLGEPFHIIILGAGLTGTEAAAY